MWLGLAGSTSTAPIERPVATGHVNEAALEAPGGGFARDESIRGDAARSELRPCRCQGGRQSSDRVGRVRSGNLLGSVDPFPRISPVIVVFLGTTIMDPARFRFPTPTPIESPLGCFERVSSMEHPEVAEGWLCVASGLFRSDESHRRRCGH